MRLVHSCVYMQPKNQQRCLLSTYGTTVCFMIHDTQSLISVHRVTGYELAPLRVDLEASVERPRLHMEADTDHGLHFTYPASMLLQEEQVTHIHVHVYTCTCMCMYVSMHVIVHVHRS